MSKHKNKNRTPKKTFLDAMREIEPSLTEDNLFSEIYDNALEIEDVGYEDINAAYADVDSDMMTSDTVIFSKIGNKYLVLFDRDDYTSAEADVESIEFSIFDNESDAAKKFKEKIFEKKAENLPDYETAIGNFEKAVKERTGEDVCVEDIGGTGSFPAWSIKHGRNLIAEYFNDFDNPESIKAYLKREKEFADVFRVFGYNFEEVHKAYRDWGDNTRKYVFSFGFRIPGSDEYVSEDCYLPIPSVWQHRQRCPFELVNIERMRAELEKAKVDYVADQEE